MKDKIQNYILEQLKLHGNTIISAKDLKRIGGTEKLLTILREEGFDCRVKDTTNKIELGEQFTGTVYDHVVIEVKR